MSASVCPSPTLVTMEVNGEGVIGDDLNSQLRSCEKSFLEIYFDLALVEKEDVLVHAVIVVSSGVVTKVIVRIVREYHMKNS